MKKLLYFLFLSCSFLSFAQVPIDTVETENGLMVVFEDRTWKYIDTATVAHVHKEFPVVTEVHLNEYLESLIEEDSVLSKMKQPWSNDVCFASGLSNDFSHYKDTLWLCLVDELNSEFVVPNPGIVTSRYGYRHRRYHKGIDIDLNVGDTVRAAFSGKVRYSMYNSGGYGYLVIIRHYNGLETYYAHLSKLLVEPNQDVKAGDIIGLGGNTGHSYGAHLHFEVRFYEVPINPEEIIDFSKKELKDENLLVHKAIFRPGAKPSDQVTSVETVASVQAVATAARKYYKVRPGDTLSQIASRNNTTVSSLCRLNGIRPTTLLQIGRQIRVR